MEVQENILKCPLFEKNSAEIGQNNFNRGNNCRKRQRITDENDNDSFAKASITENKRGFLHFVRDSGVYQTDVFKQSKEGDTIYLPLTGDLFVNLDRADEISFTEGLFFTGDENGRYCNSVRGNKHNLDIFISFFSKQIT